MRNLMNNSGKICNFIAKSIVTAKPNTFNCGSISFNPISEYYFSTKKQKISHAALQTKIPENAQLVGQVLTLIDYASIQQLYKNPGVLASVINKLIKLLEFNPQNKSKKFFHENRQKIHRFIFDLKCYNSESHLSTKQILLAFYLIKVASDCGYFNRIEGFEFRGIMKLVNNFPLPQSQSPVQNQLTLNEVVYGYWLASSLRFNNHEYKWKTFVLMLSVRGKWRKQNQQMIYQNNTDPTKLPQVPPFTLQQISSILSTYFMEEVHMISELRMMEFLINLLVIAKFHYLTEKQYQQNQSLFLQVFNQLISIEQHWLNGKTYLELQQIINIMSGIIHKKIIEKVQTSHMDVQGLNTFLKNANPNEMLTKNYTRTKATLQIDKIKEEEVYRYFILLNEMLQNKIWMKNICFNQFAKLQFLLFEILQVYFESIENSDQTKTLSMLFLKVRTWINRRQLQMDQLTKQIHQQQKAHFYVEAERKQKKQQKLKELNLAYQNLVKDIADESKQILDFASKRIKKQLNSIDGLQNDQKRKAIYLTADQKKLKTLKSKILIKSEQDIVKPMKDFIFANGKTNISNNPLLYQAKNCLIGHFQQFVSEIYGQGIKKKILTSQNSYFWTLKYMRLQSQMIITKELLLDQFQSIMKFIIKDMKSKKSKSYTIVSLYNIYAYLCKIEEKIIDLQEKLSKESNTKQNINSNSLQIESFMKKSQYQSFIQYKKYISWLVFRKDKNSDYSKQLQEIKNIIPVDCRIEEILTEQVPESNLQTGANMLQSLNLRKYTQDKNNNSFNLQIFFIIVFKTNRYHNHRILSQEVLLNLFGNQKLMTNNVSEYITKVNQRSGQNFHPLLYMILLAQSKQVDRNIQHTLSVEKIKQKLVQTISQKAKGSLLLNILREIISPRKSSFMKKTALKYRHKPYSIFQSVSRESCTRKSTIINQFFTYFHTNKTSLFPFVQMILLNIQTLGNDSSEVMSSIFLPWVVKQIKSKQIAIHAVEYILNSILRLLRFHFLETNAANQKYFVDFLQQLMPNTFKNIERNKNEHIYQNLYGYITQVQHLNKLSKINSSKLNKILKSCRQNLLKANDSDQNSGLKNGDVYKDGKDARKNSNKVSNRGQQTNSRKTNNYFDKLVQKLEGVIEQTQGGKVNRTSLFDRNEQKRSAKGRLFKKDVL